MADVYAAAVVTAAAVDRGHALDLAGGHCVERSRRGVHRRHHRGQSHVLLHDGWSLTLLDSLPLERSDCAWVCII